MPKFIVNVAIAVETDDWWGNAASAIGEILSAAVQPGGTGPVVDWMFLPVDGSLPRQVGEWPAWVETSDPIPSEEQARG